MKVIKELHGKPMIVHMLDRLKLAKKPEEIIICTSTISQDDPLEQIAKEQNVKCFRGSPEDVLQRLSDAASQFEVETVINCTADNPFVDPEYIDLLYSHHISNNYEFTKINGLPWGTFSYAINHESLIKACKIKEETDTEVWHGYFMDTGRFKWGALDVSDDAVYWPELRLTVDTPEDFEMVNQVFNHLYHPGSVFPLKEIVELCKFNPDLPAINSHVQQKPGLPIKYK